MTRRIGVIGLGYVGLPVAIAFARKFPNVVGFDINREKVSELQKGFDRTGEVNADELRSTSLSITSNPKDLKDIDFFIVAVPTPIDRVNRPELSALIKASEIVGSVMQQGAIVVYESTVYPGVTEEVCGPVLANCSGLIQGIEFNLGYSPERINPGDKTHRLESIKKVISADNEEILNIIESIYGVVVEAGIYSASSIKVAEAAKVIENTQRDLNISLMNELAIIFEKMGIRTNEVLEAAGTKWNFLPFTPGLVGGHCIGVDPYYLTFKAEELGYHPQVILAGRRINDCMGKYIAEQTVKRLAKTGKDISKAKIGLLGLTFKEDVPDIRNSRVPDIIQELNEYGIKTLIHDPVCNPKEALYKYGITLSKWTDLYELDGIIIAVGHKEYRTKEPLEFVEKLKNNCSGVIIDVKSLFKPQGFPEHIVYWSL